MRRRALLAGLVGLGAATAANPGPARASRFGVALVVGVSQYQTGPGLASAVPDATLIATAFTGLGIDTDISINPTQNDLLRSLANLRLRAHAADFVLVYVAAHGVMIGGQSHIIVRDTPLKGTVTLAKAVSEAVILQAVSDKPRQRILFLDTCREHPGLSALTRWNCRVSASPQHAGIHVSYATQPGAVALDGDDGNSPFARALARALRQPGQELAELSRQVRLNVVRDTNGLQIPWDRSSLLAPVILNPSISD